MFYTIALYAIIRQEGNEASYMNASRVVVAAALSAFLIAFLFLAPVVSYPVPPGLYNCPANGCPLLRYGSITYWALGVGATVRDARGYSVAVVTSTAEVTSTSTVSYTGRTTSQGSPTTSVSVASQQGTVKTKTTTVTTIVNNPAATTTVTQCSSTATVTVTSIEVTNAQTTVTYTVTTTATNYGSTTTVTACAATTTTTTVTQGGG